MKITKQQLRQIIKEEILKEAQFGRFTGGAAPLDPDPVDSGPVPLGQLKQLFDILVDMGKPVEDILAMPEFVEVGVTSPEQLGEDIEERKLKKSETSQKEKLAKKYKPAMDNFKDQYGEEGESVYYATMTKKAKKGEQA